MYLWASTCSSFPLLKRQVGVPLKAPGDRLDRPYFLVLPFLNFTPDLAWLVTQCLSSSCVSSSVWGLEDKQHVDSGAQCLGLCWRSFKPTQPLLFPCLQSIWIYFHQREGDLGGGASRWWTLSISANTLLHEAQLRDGVTERERGWVDLGPHFLICKGVWQWGQPPQQLWAGSSAQL